MSKIYSILDLRKEFLASRELDNRDDFMQKQQELLEQLIKENEQLKEKLSNEKPAVSSLIIDNGNTEELVCIEQIKILQLHSQKRELDINEVKKLDLLIKNLRLIRSQPTENTNTNYRDVSELDLISIASSKSDK
jgi:phosphoribosylanthranilate isomerase